MSRVKLFVSLMKFSGAILCVMNENELIQFLLQEMKAQGLSPADISRRGNLSPSQVSKVLNGDSPAGQKALEGFAIALRLPVSLLYQKSGRLPLPIDKDDKIAEIEHIYYNLDDPNRSELLEYARLRLKLQEGNAKPSHASRRSVTA